MCGLATPEEKTLIGDLTGRGLDHLTDKQTDIRKEKTGTYKQIKRQEDHQQTLRQTHQLLIETFPAVSQILGEVFVPSLAPQGLFTLTNHSVAGEPY